MKTLLLSKLKPKAKDNNHQELCLNIVSKVNQLHPIKVPSKNEEVLLEKKEDASKSLSNPFMIFNTNQLELKTIQIIDADNPNEKVTECFEKKKVIKKYKPINHFITRSKGLHNILHSLLTEDSILEQNKVNAVTTNQIGNQQYIKPHKNKIFKMELFTKKNNPRYQPKQNSLMRFINDKLPQKEINVIRQCFEKSTHVTSRPKPHCPVMNCTQSQFDLKEMQMTKMINKEDHYLINQFDNMKSLSLTKYMEYSSMPSENKTSLVKPRKRYLFPYNIHDTNINIDSINCYTRAHPAVDSFKYDSMDLAFQSNEFIQINSNPKQRETMVKKRNVSVTKRISTRLHQREILLNEDEAWQSLPKISKSNSLSNMFQPNRQYKTLYVGSLSRYKIPIKASIEGHQNESEKKGSTINNLQLNQNSCDFGTMNAKVNVKRRTYSILRGHKQKEMLSNERSESHWFQ